MITFLSFFSINAPLLAVATNLFTGLLVFRKSPHRKQAQILLFFNILVALWATTCFIQSFIRSSSIALNTDYIMYWIAIWIIPMYLFLVHSFTPLNKTILHTSIAFGLMLSAINLTPYMRTGVILKASARFVTIPGNLWFLVIIFFGFYSLYGIKQLMTRDTSQNDKARPIIIIAFALLMSAGAAYFLMCLPLFSNPIPIHTLNFLSSIMAVIYSILLAYAILKHELLDISIILTRSTAILIVSILVVLSIVLCFIFITSPLVRGLSLSVVIVLWTFNAKKLRISIQTPLEEKWIHNWYDPQRIIDTLTLHLVPVIKRTELYTIISVELQQVFQVKSITLLLPNNKDMVKFTPPTKLRIYSQEVPFNSRIIDFFNNNRGILLAQHCPNHLYRYISKITKSCPKLLIPLFSNEDVYCILCMEAKISGDPFYDKDLQCLHVVQHQVTLVLNRIKPYERASDELEHGRQRLEHLSQDLTSTNTHLNKIGYWVTHDLKNALTGLQLYSKNLLFNRPSSEQQTIDDTLNTLKLEIRRFLQDETHHETFSPKEVIIDIVDELSYIAQQHKVVINHDFKGSHTLHGDRYKFGMMIRNMIENAIQHSQPGGAIHVRLSPWDKEGRSIMIEIEDEGVGISEKDLKRIFEKGYSGSGAGKDILSKRKGTGLGLYFCQMIVNELNGHIEVSSKQGKGSLFCIYL